jgi:hypothetical protein
MNQHATITVWCNKLSTSGTARQRGVHMGIAVLRGGRGAIEHARSAPPARCQNILKPYVKYTARHTHNTSDNSLSVLGSDELLTARQRNILSLGQDSL